MLTSGRTKNASIFICGKEKPQSYTNEKPPFVPKWDWGFFWFHTPRHTRTHESPSPEERVKRDFKGIKGIFKTALLVSSFGAFKITNHYSPVLKSLNENSYTGKY